MEIRAVGRNTLVESDAELVRRMHRRDPAALETWFNLHADAVYGFAFYRVGRNADLAAEVTQETFTRALGRLDAFDPDRGAMVSWLCTMSRNCIRDVLRDRGHAPLAALWDSVDRSLLRLYAELDRTPLTVELAESKETQDLVGVTLANLPEAYRAVLVAKYMDDKSLQQIASDRSTTVDAVKGLLKRARKAFKQAFGALAGTAVHIEELGGA